MKKTKRKNPSDLTLRNLHAMKKRIAELEDRVQELHAFVVGLAVSVRNGKPEPRSANSTGVGLEGGNR